MYPGCVNRQTGEGSVEYHLGNRTKFRQRPKGLTHHPREGRVDAHHGECITPRGEAGLMILGDVDAGVSEQGADPPDHAGDVVVVEYQGDPARDQVHPEVVDPYDTGMPLGEYGARHPDRPSSG